MLILDDLLFQCVFEQIMTSMRGTVQCLEHSSWPLNLPLLLNITRSLRWVHLAKRVRDV